MFQRIFLFALIAALAAPLAAQAPADWRVRIDESRNAQDPDDTPELTFMQIGGGFRSAGGPAGTFWRPGQSATGNFTVRGNFTLNKPSNHNNFYGLILGGSNLDAATQNYIYFLVSQEGTFIVKRRNGAAVTDVQGDTPHAAIRRPDNMGRSVNALEVRVAVNAISYVVNGTVVHTTPKTGQTAMTNGLVGVRINHVLDVTVDGFQVLAAN